MYDLLARYYDLTHDRLTADIGLILSLAARLPTPVVELGCGTGRLLLPLARARHTVLGVDNSAAMLARARSRLAQEPAEVAQRVTLLAADMVHLELPRRAGLVIIPYNTLLHLEPLRHLPAVLKHVRRHLLPQGQLFIDLPNPFFIAATPDEPLLALENVVTDPESGELILQQAASRVDTHRQILEITWIYDRSPATGGPVTRDVIPMTYHYLFPHEVQRQLGAAGLQQVGQYGSYSLAPFDEESERLLIVAEPV